VTNLSKYRCETCDVGFDSADLAFEHASKYTHGITVQAQVYGPELLAKAIAEPDIATPAHSRRQAIPIMKAAGIESDSDWAPVVDSGARIPTDTALRFIAKESDPEWSSIPVASAADREGIIESAERKLAAHHAREAANAADRELSRQIARRVADSGMPTGTMGIIYSLAQAAVAWALADARADRLADALSGDDERGPANTAFEEACHEEILRDADLRRIAKALVVELDR